MHEKTTAILEGMIECARINRQEKRDREALLTSVDLVLRKFQSLTPEGSPVVCEELSCIQESMNVFTKAITTLILGVGTEKSLPQFN